ncbi:fungal-specific transcription factor domain-containing protein [Roridomyces roridus]|uniref:Fungal-specific transcription factor domain-containing protein n=1 Tax=Roridomyces roridus TaxID=1738132 RepID=A0AAD7C4D9_9AGAR|nr:fungal-specific transcription factor domain-containing protein [Roridomyces roridus]
MPVDPSRRSSRKSADDETDVRRARGELSCAECRRLKLKCDKKLPCSSCIRRGCPSICPNGSLSSQGTRFVLASTDHLHTKIGEMGQRIRQLEDALSIFQASTGSNDTHPLLRDELLSIKFGPEKGPASEKPPRVQETPTESIDALGTLTIGDDGEGKYFGRSAGSETLFLAGAAMEMATAPDDEISPALSVEIAKLSNSFPFSAGGPPDRALDLLFDYLPEQPRAWALCETYMEQCSWQFRPITRDEIIDDFLTPIYKSLRDLKSWTGEGDFQHSISPHRLAVMFMLFGLGALVDLTLEPHNVESERYYHASRASLALRSVFDSPEMATVQAILLMSAYRSMGGRNYTMESSWSLVCLGSKLAQSLGLHRDSARWNMDPKTVNRRRGLFWELFSTELFQSVALGRPPSIRLSYVDCEFPGPEPETLDENGQPQMGYYDWKYSFTRDVFSIITERTLTAESPPYEAILELDRLVRAKTLPPHLNMFLGREDENCTPSVYMRGCLLGQYRSVALLYIHKTFFAQAMLDHPANPLQSPFAPSFLAAYRCASGMIKANLNHFERFPDLCCRWWMIWTHLFSAAIIVGCIVTRSPSSSMASTAFIELGLACDLFEKGAKHSRRARSGLAILCKLREKAFQVYSQFRSGNPAPAPSGFGLGLWDHGEDELALFGGQTRVLVNRLISRKNKEAKGVSSSSSSAVSSPAPSHASDPSHMEVPDVHPALVDYLALFPPSHAPQEYQPQQNAYRAMPPQPPPSSIPYGYDFDEIMSAPTQNASYFVDPDTPPQDISQFGLMMSGDSGIDTEWKGFIQDSFGGLLPGY